MGCYIRRSFENLRKYRAHTKCWRNKIKNEHELIEIRSKLVHQRWLDIYFETHTKKFMSRKMHKQWVKIIYRCTESFLQISLQMRRNYSETKQKVQFKFKIKQITVNYVHTCKQSFLQMRKNYFRKHIIWIYKWFKRKIQKMEVSKWDSMCS